MSATVGLRRYATSILNVSRLRQEAIRGYALRRSGACLSGQLRIFTDHVNADAAVLVYFHTNRCKPCISITRALEEMETEKEQGAVSSSIPQCSSSHAYSQEDTLGLTQRLLRLLGITFADVAVSPEALGVLREGVTRGVRIISVDTDENPVISALHDIRSVPTFVAYRCGRIIGHLEGASEQKLQELVSKLLVEEGGATN
ncbi:thioredoxin [Trypanosoma brucei equiperdum]|uniref:Thioredoxin n=1 Tax=Trypanosoma brucei equiperdum TaxID=630700 RepID=A0A3L6LBZ1_9TRYP|nr:thioredoxin [Trypanosoma brucei equiperdum]